MKRLSIIIVARNEALNIVDCVRSARFADEVIVLDSGSTDGTADLARAEGATVAVTDWPGYGPQNNRGIDRAAGDRLVYPVEANEVFLKVSAQEAASLRKQGFDFYDWGPGEIRLVTSWDQDMDAVARLAVAIEAL